MRLDWVVSFAVGVSIYSSEERVYSCSGVWIIAIERNRERATSGDPAGMFYKCIIQSKASDTSVYYQIAHVGGHVKLSIVTI